MVVFQQQPPPWGQGDGCSSDNRAAALETITASIKSKAWLMITHHWIQLIHHKLRDIGGVAHHHIQMSPPGPKRIPPTSLVQVPVSTRCPSGQVSARQGKGSSAAIHSMPLPLRPVSSQSKGQRSAARTQISPHPKPRSGFGLTLSAKSKGQINQLLCFLTGDQSIRRHKQLKLPPGTTANKVL